MTSNHFSSRRRGGFMTLGLILCVILALTVAGVLWNYQYLTIQNVELECAARSAIQAAINDNTIESIFTNNSIANTTLETVLQQTRSRQNSLVYSVTVDSPNKILIFTRPRKLGIFSGTIDASKRAEIEGDPSNPNLFTQKYRISGSAGAYTFNKCN